MKEPTTKEKAALYDKLVAQVTEFHRLRNGANASQAGLHNLEQLAQDMGGFVDQVLLGQQPGSDKRVLFMLYCATAGEGGWATYVSNADRESMTESVVALLSRVRQQGKGLN